MTNSNLHYRYINRIFPVLLFILIFNLSLHANITRYVAITGDDLEGANACTDSSSPCRTIAQAINVAAAGDVVNISAGVYTETLTINKTLSLTGSGQGVTIIQAHAEPGVSIARVIQISQGLEVAISGVTIRHGGTAAAVSNGGGLYNNGSTLKLTDVTFSDNTSFGSGGAMATAHKSVDTLINVIFQGNYSHNFAGGINMIEENNTILIDVVFTDNFAEKDGGAIYAAQNSRFELHGVTFNENSAEGDGGAIINYSAHSPILNNVIFDGNTADGNGGGLNNGNSDPHLVNVTFLNNIAAGNGGAVYNNESNPVLQNAVISGNSAELGGGMNNVDSSPTLTNVLFSGNKADMLGGGMRNSDGNSNPVLTNVTFSGNSAAEGGGMANSSAGPVIVNSIFWNNEAMSGVGTLSASIFNDGPPGPTVSYSLVQGIDYSGENNLDGTDPANDPIFVLMPDPTDAPTTTGDLRLQEGSAVIDMGDPDTDLSVFPGGPDNPLDLDDKPRVFNGRIDLGAYEYTDPTSIRYIADLPKTMELQQNYPNPFNPSTIIGYSLPERTKVELTIFDLLGRKIAVLVASEQPAGSYEVTFNASGLGSGVYIYKLRAGTEVRTGRMTLLR